MAVTPAQRRKWLAQRAEHEERTILRVMDEREGRTIAELAERTRIPLDRTTSLLWGLFHRGRITRRVGKTVQGHTSRSGVRWVWLRLGPPPEEPNHR